MAQRLVEPFTAGSYAGDAEELSLRSLFPVLAEWEDRHGSLTRGLRAARARSQGAPSASPFTSLRKGMASLPQVVASNLRSFTILQGKRVEGLAWSMEAGRPLFRLSLQGDDSIMADCVVIAIPAPSAATLVRPVAPNAAPLLERLRFASTASISLAFRREAVAHPLNGSGFLVPRTEPSSLTASTWSSSKWPGRAPREWVLLRAFVGWIKDASFMEQDDPDMIRSVT